MIRGRRLSAGRCEGIKNCFVNVNYYSDTVKSMKENTTESVGNAKEIS
jgi:hypothetical protein